MNSASDTKNTRSIRNSEENNVENAAAPVSRGIREAAIRAEELRNRMRNSMQLDSGDLHDDFYIDPTKIPEGWDYNWKTKSIFGMEDRDYMREMAQAGWEAVPVERHPEEMPVGSRGAIERKGMILMERPKEISDAAKQREIITARNIVEEKEKSLGISQNSGFAQRSKTINKNYSPMQIPRS
jgi:hypothetical protein